MEVQVLSSAPEQNLTAFPKPEGGTREARPTDFPPHFPKRIRSVAFGDAHCFSGEEQVRAKDFFGSNLFVKKVAIPCDCAIPLRF